MPIAVLLAATTAVFVCLSPTIMSNHHNFARSATELLATAVWAALVAGTRQGHALLFWVATGGVALAAWEIWATTRV